MIVSIIFACCIYALMILSILFFPQIKIKKLQFGSYWFIVLIGAIIMVLVTRTSLNYILSSLLADSSINPVKILVLFISMTILSIFLDEVGFFQYLASITLKRAKTSQFKLFMLLYIVVSILTVFTSNDIIILSFTPLICYFAKNAKINPLPYLAGEFVAANTWSMALIIGNPTNIYLATSYNINFFNYAKIMILPTIAGGITAFIMLLIMYMKYLKERLTPSESKFEIKDKLLLIIGIIHLSICTICLAVGSYIGLEMWLVSLISVISLFVCVLLVSLFRKNRPVILLRSLKRAPWQLIPFIISMFVIILILENEGVTSKITTLFGTNFIIFKYGISSFIGANIINNIPMSVMFSSILSPLEEEFALKAMFSTVVGSNIGAFLTPVGALAGIMWSSIIGKHNIKFGYLSFLKLGLIVAFPTIIVVLLILSIVL